ncbi:MAG TPA: YeeE/YedE thiosulfate transporter family protein, partial [Nevskiaceae bacterium]|nr:YeeE/YedE thiosulfate transporter family protein [Nevskiaceae bacterium]
AAASLLLITNGRIAGISGLYSAAWQRRDVTALLFMLGLVAAPWLTRAFGLAPPVLELQVLRIALAGLLVGIGTAIGNGCTSGHGVCGLANLSPRSLAATLTFMAVAAMVVALHLGERL